MDTTGVRYDIGNINMNKLISKLLDIFLENKLALSIKEKHEDSKLIKTLYDKPFMIHIIKYLIIGFLATVICLGLFWIFINWTPLGETDLGENIANFLSIVITMVIAYVMNRNIVFNSKDPNILKEFSKFVIARVISMIFDMASFFIFATLLKADEMLVKVVNQIVVIILNYILSKVMVFKDSKIE